MDTNLNKQGYTVPNVVESYLFNNLKGACPSINLMIGSAMQHVNMFSPFNHLGYSFSAIKSQDLAHSR